MWKNVGHKMMVLCTILKESEEICESPESAGAELIRYWGPIFQQAQRLFRQKPVCPFYSLYWLRPPFFFYLFDDFCSTVDGKCDSPRGPADIWYPCWRLSGPEGIRIVYNCSLFLLGGGLLTTLICIIVGAFKKCVP